MFCDYIVRLRDAPEERIVLGKDHMIVFKIKYLANSNVFLPKAIMEASQHKKKTFLRISGKTAASPRMLVSPLIISIL